MFLLAHLQKYLKEHPEEYDNVDDILWSAREILSSTGAEEISSKEAEELLGEENAEDFLALVTNNPEYQKITSDSGGN